MPSPCALCSVPSGDGAQGGSGGLDVPQAPHLWDRAAVPSRAGDTGVWGLCSEPASGLPLSLPWMMPLPLGNVPGSFPKALPCRAVLLGAAAGAGSLPPCTCQLILGSWAAGSAPACLPASVSLAGVLQVLGRCWSCHICSALPSVGCEGLPPGGTWAGGAPWGRGHEMILPECLARLPRVSPLGLGAAWGDALSSPHGTPLLFQALRAPPGQHDPLPSPRCAIPAPDGRGPAATSLTPGTG